MAIDVETKDCTALGDGELSEMADICAEGPAGFDVGLLSKQREEWVLVTQARENGKLCGFAFSTLERIGGTPCVLIGPGSVTPTSRPSSSRSTTSGVTRSSPSAGPWPRILPPGRAGAGNRFVVKLGL